MTVAILVDGHRITVDGIDQKKVVAFMRHFATMVEQLGVAGAFKRARELKDQAEAEYDRLSAGPEMN